MFVCTLYNNLLTRDDYDLGSHLVAIKSQADIWADEARKFLQIAGDEKVNVLYGFARIRHQRALESSHN